VAAALQVISVSDIGAAINTAWKIAARMAAMSAAIWCKLCVAGLP